MNHLIKVLKVARSSLAVAFGFLGFMFLLIMVLVGCVGLWAWIALRRIIDADKQGK